MRHIEIHKNDEPPEKEFDQISIDGSFQIVKERRTLRGHAAPGSEKRAPTIVITVRALLIPSIGNLVELSGIEPLTPCLQSRCSPS